MAAGKLMERKDIPENLTWDLKKIYSSESAWEDDLTALNALVEAVKAFQGKLSESAETLRDALQAMV